MAKRSTEDMPHKKLKKGRQIGRKAFGGITAVLLCTLLIVLMTGTVVGGYFFLQAAAVVANDTKGINLQEEKAAQSLTTIIYRRQPATKTEKAKWVEYHRLHGEENRIWLDIDKNDPKYKNICNAAIDLEDKRFEEHHGVDWQRFIGVMTKYAFSQGASTITQQLIKNLTGEKDVTAIRKFNEILSALNLEKHNTKTLILEAYLNTIYLGRGCYGVKTGAERYFGKEVEDLSVAECASLVAITKAPYYYDPIDNFENNQARKEVCLSEMYKAGDLSKEEYEAALAEKIVFTNNPDYKPSSDASAATQNTENNYYVDFLIERVIEDLMEQKDMSKAEATRKLYYGGLKIYACVDDSIQKETEDVFKKRVTFSSIKGTDKNPAPQASMAIMDYSGRVVAIAGGAGEKPGNRSLNRAAYSWRQPGSTIKPLAVYGPAIEKNLITWSTLLKDEAFVYRSSMWPHNQDGSFGSGRMVTAQYALRNSLNTVSARVTNFYVKVSDALDFLQENFGFRKLDNVNDRVLPAMATGAMTYGFTALEECAAYAVFGNGGTYYEPYCYEQVTDYKGSETILEPKKDSTRVFSEGSAKVMNELLATVPIDRYQVGNNGANILKFPHFAKTGTTSDDKDRWFSCGTPYYVGTVWFGYDKPKEIRGADLFPAAKIWLEVFNRIHKGLDTSKKFPSTADAVKRSYCTETGLLAGENCPTATGWFKKSNLPATCPGNHVPETTAPASSGSFSVTLPPELSSMADAAISAASSLAERFTP